MQALAGISFVALIGASLVVGVRLLWLARRTRELPEWVLGANLVLVMGIAYPGMIVTEADLGWSLAAQRAVMVAMNVVINTGFFLLFVFTASVFRPGAAWTKWLLAMAASLFVVHIMLVTDILYSFDDLAEGRPAANRTGLISLGTAAVGYAWSSIEAFMHWGRLRRREKIGLVDPVLCNRMWLWAMMSVSSFAGALATWVYLVLGIDVLVTPSAMLIVSLTGLGQGLFLWLTFLPPAAYVGFVRGRAAPSA